MRSSGGKPAKTSTSITPQPRAADLLAREGGLAARIAADLAARDIALAEGAASDLATTDRPITVVWCEDDPSVQSLFLCTWSLEGMAYGWAPHADDRILFAPDGEEALRLVEQHDPELFVTDLYHYSEPNGLLLLERLSPRHGMALGYITGATIEAHDMAWIDIAMEKPIGFDGFFSKLAPVVRALRDRTYKPLPTRVALDRDGRDA